MAGTRVSKLADHPQLVRDGHKLAIVALDWEARPEFDIVCDPETCQAKWSHDDGDNTKEEAEEPCWLRYWMREDDAWSESVEGRIEGSGPYPIAWYWNGDYVETLLDQHSDKPSSTPTSGPT